MVSDFILVKPKQQILCHRPLLLSKHLKHTTHTNAQFLPPFKTRAFIGTLHSHCKIYLRKWVIKTHLNNNFPQPNLTWLSQPLTTHYLSVLISPNIPRWPVLGYSCWWLEPSEVGWWFQHQRGSQHFVPTLRVLELWAVGSPQTPRPGRTDRNHRNNRTELSTGFQHMTVCVCNPHPPTLLCRQVIKT